MLQNQDILNMFIDKSCVFMGDFMNGTGTGEMIGIIKDEALAEFVAHREKNHSTKGINSEQEIINAFNNAKSWAEGRPNYFYDYIRQKWNLGTAIPVTINKELATSDLPDEVLVNGIKLTKSVFDGKLFQGRSIKLEGNTEFANDQIVTGWRITTDGITDTKEGATYTFNVPDCQSLSINAIMGDNPAPQIAIGQYGAVSFSSIYPLDFTNQPVNAYIVTAKNGNYFTKEQVYKVPAETGLVVEGAQGTYRIPIADSSTSLEVNNLLQSTATAPFTVPENDGKVYYGLFYSSEKEKVGFKKMKANESIAEGKSYLCLSENLALENSEIFFDDATTIQRVNNDTWTDGKAYNLNGQRVDKNNYKGVMIVNGKKVINNRK